MKRAQRLAIKAATKAVARAGPETLSLLEDLFMQGYRAAKNEDADNLEAQAAELQRALPRAAIMNPAAIKMIRHYMAMFMASADHFRQQPDEEYVEPPESGREPMKPKLEMIHGSKEDDENEQDRETKDRTPGDGSERSEEEHGPG